MSGWGGGGGDGRGWAGGGGEVDQRPVPVFICNFLTTGTGTGSVYDDTGWYLVSIS